MLFLFLFCFLCFADDFYHWNVLNTFWTTKHDFKPHFPSPLFKKYAFAASYLNMYPFAAVMFLKLGNFIIFTALDNNFTAKLKALNILNYAFVIIILLWKPYTEKSPDGWLRVKNIHKWTKIIAGRICSWLSACRDCLLTHVGTLAVIWIFFSDSMRMSLIMPSSIEPDESPGHLSDEIFGRYSG